MIAQRPWNASALRSQGAELGPGERWADINCSCGFQDHGAAKIEPPAAGFMWAWGPCPRCNAGMMFENEKSEGESNGPDTAPDQSLYAHARKYHPLEVLGCR
jgi:hypothetical protein